MLKRKSFFWIILFSLMLLLAACGSDEDDQTESAESAEAETGAYSDEDDQTESAEDSAEEVLSDSDQDELAEDFGLSQLFEPFEDDENLYLYSGHALEDMNYPELMICDSGLLFYDEQYSESETSSVVFTVFSPESGEVVCSAGFASEFITDLTSYGDGFIYCDSSLGYVRILDGSLSETGYYEEEANYEYWYVSSDGEYLYKIDAGELVLCDLENESRSVLLSSTVSLYGSEAMNGYAPICYVDDETQLTEIMLLNLDDGELIRVDFDEAISTVSRSGESYLAFMDDTSYEYISGSEDYLMVLSSDNLTLAQVAGSDDLLCMYDDSGRIFLYDSEGTFIASCLPQGEYPWYGDTFCIYSEEYDGCFLLVYDDDGPDLYFWDFNAAASVSEGEDLLSVSLEEYQELPEGSVCESALYERAEAISSEYGVDILIADQCETVYEDFTAEQVNDTALIEASLDLIETALSGYPEGFFEQLRFDQITRIQINLCGTLIPTNDSWGEESYNGFTQEYKNTYLMVLDANQLYTDTLYHEFSHIIDARLTWDAYCREDALFSEEVWMSLNPDGFEYAYVYDGFEELVFEGDEFMYFIDSYSMVSPTEDRARIMEFAMSGYSGYFTDDEPIMAKLEYYCECIRDAFDTSGWPDQTLWELG